MVCDILPMQLQLAEVSATTYNLSLRLASDPSQVALAIGNTELQGGKVNYFFALGDIVGGETLSVRNIQPAEDEPSPASTAVPFWLSLFF